MIEVFHLTKLYGPFKAVDDLSFSAGKKKILGLVGPNGAGKTTTLRSLAGILRPAEGTISICGIDLLSQPVEAKQRLAFMPDEPRLFEYLTVEEHLRFVARVYGVTDWRPRADELITELELGERRKALPSELSRGMKQKLIIACGLLHAPEVLIFDEPLTGLDPLGIRRMKNTILKRAEAGATVILSSHLLHLVEELCSSVVIIHRGRKVAEGTIAELKAASDAGGTLEEAFIRMTSEAEPEAKA